MAARAIGLALRAWRGSAGHAGMQKRSLAGAPLFWTDVPEAPKDPILGITEKYLADPNPDKLNFGVGAYRDDDGKPVVLNCVREAESRIAGKSFMEYLPIGGSKDFCDRSVELAYGENAACIKENRVAAIQTLSGTGSCRIMADFMHRYAPNASVYMPTPTWSNHHNIWRDAGVEQHGLRYYKEASCSLDYDALLEDIANAPAGSFFLLHACAHNPTGVDPTPEQWKGISQAMLAKGHFAFFDMAYQGFASGDCERDGEAIRIFLDDGHLVACSQSYAKNMGLYGQRIGCFSIVCADEKEKVAVESQLKAIARPMYSNPPMHGAMIVNHVLSDPALKKQWFGEVKGMADRIIAMRTQLRAHLEKEAPGRSWNHVTDQIGMFCFSGLTPEQVDRMASEHSMYMTRNGRISMAGVTTKNVERLAKAMAAVLA